MASEQTERIREIPQRYRTSHGTEHATKEEAERQQAVFDAVDAFEKAQKRLGHLLAQSERTADGHPFKFGVLRTYYRVRDVWGGGPPSVERVEFGMTTEVNFYSDPIELVVMDSVEGQFGTYRRRTYHISDLYAEQGNAEAAALESQVAWYRDRMERHPALVEAVKALVASEQEADDG